MRSMLSMAAHELCRTQKFVAYMIEIEGFAGRKGGGWAG